MRILCINPLFAPVADSEAFCSAKVAIGLMGRGIDVAVLAFEENRRSSGVDHSPIWSSLKDITIRIPAPQAKELFRSSICGVRYRTVRDTRWVHSTVLAAKTLHAKRPFDLVYSRSVPMISHVAGYWISRCLRLPWIANIDDPWDLHLVPEIVHPKSSAIADQVSNYWLRKTLNVADLVTYPTQRLWAHHVRASGTPHNAEVIPHIGLARAAEPDPARIAIVHAGKIGKHEVTNRSANGFFGAMGRLLRNAPDLREIVKVVLVGPEDSDTSVMAAGLGLKENLVITGRVDYEDSLRYMGSANVCLLIEGNMRDGIYLPSKFADYVVSRKPVIALSPENGTIADLTAFNSVIRADPDDEEAILEVLSKVVSTIRNNESWKIVPSPELMRIFAEGRVVDKLISCIDRVLARHKGASC